MTLNELNVLEKHLEIWIYQVRSAKVYFYTHEWTRSSIFLLHFNFVFYLSVCIMYTMMISYLHLTCINEIKCEIENRVSKLISIYIYIIWNSNILNFLFYFLYMAPMYVTLKLTITYRWTLWYKKSSCWRTRLA